MAALIANLSSCACSCSPSETFALTSARHQKRPTASCAARSFRQLTVSGRSAGIPGVPSGGWRRFQSFQAASLRQEGESEEKVVSIEEVLHGALSEGSELVFSSSEEEAVDEAATADPFGSAGGGKQSPTQEQSPQVLPSSADMEKVLSAYIGAPPSTRDISVHELKEALAAADPPLLLDVRTPGEFAGGHAPTAINAPLQEIAARVESGDLQLAGRQVAVICQAGGRSARAAVELATAFAMQDICNVLGGTGAWIAAGYPVEK